jgi:hypothetical protein
MMDLGAAYISLISTVSVARSRASHADARSNRKVLTASHPYSSPLLSLELDEHD